MTIQSIRALYYITHIDNVNSILLRGILSHQAMEVENVQTTKIYDEEIISRRKNREVYDSKKLPFFANLYFNPRNAMLYRVVNEISPRKIVVISLKKDILTQSDIFISWGNAASYSSEIMPISKSGELLAAIQREVIGKEWWTDFADSKRKMMAECLVPHRISADYIEAIYVSAHDIADQLRSEINLSHIKIILEPDMFFQPGIESDVTDNLTLVTGDMFFSRLHTLTVSVNTVGVMGKGLASRAKYQFPDVYVYYQDLCRSKVLKMGKPALYKRESSFDYQLADEPSSLKNPNSETWFLLFPTKGHWRDNADYDGIESGLKWLSEAYIDEGIKSLAMPALGCGLGKLDWKDIGPLMCKYLTKLSINVMIYLPGERKIPSEYLTKRYLLR